MLARHIDKVFDLAERAKELFPQMRPAQLLAMTPIELVVVLGEIKAKEVAFDQLGELQHINHVKRAGKPPLIPRWLLPKVPRRKKLK